jgi:hypothetical protein
MTQPFRNPLSWWSRLIRKRATQTDEAGSRKEVSTDHIRRAVVVIGSFLAVICLMVLLKGILGEPRLPRHGEDVAAAAPPANPEAGLSAYQEKLQQYRQTRQREPVSGSGTGMPSSPEDAQFVKQQLRMPMLVKEAPSPGNVAAMVPVPENPAPVARNNPELDQRLGDLRRRLAELRAQQNKAGEVQ